MTIKLSGRYREKDKKNNSGIPIKKTTLEPCWSGEDMKSTVQEVWKGVKVCKTRKTVSTLIPGLNCLEDSEDTKGLGSVVFPCAPLSFSFLSWWFAGRD